VIAATEREGSEEVTRRRKEKEESSRLLLKLITSYCLERGRNGEKHRSFKSEKANHPFKRAKKGTTRRMRRLFGGLLDYIGPNSKLHL